MYSFISECYKFLGGKLVLGVAFRRRLLELGSGEYDLLLLLLTIYIKL